MRTAFSSLPLLSEYQVRAKKLPTFSRRVGVETLWNEASLLRFLELALDEFSTLGRFCRTDPKRTATLQWRGNDREARGIDGAI
jgi:hypothetical protein